MIGIMSDMHLMLSKLAGRQCAFAAGASVFRVGDPVRVLHIVRSGAICLIRHHEGGSALILQRARPGSILAEASLYSARYHCDAIAETAAITWVVQRHEVRRKFDENAEFAEAWASFLAHEVQRTRFQAELLSLKTVRARLAAWIAWNGALPAKGEWSRVAMEIGVSAEALYREIAIRRRDKAPRASRARKR
jgi:CRP/FNR family transcriptional regulator, dissimilatory nitrate respiration regulator